MTSNDERRVEILKYVMDQQTAKQRTTKAKVMRYMADKGLSSGETTHNLIKELLIEKKLNKEEVNSQVHFLTINEKFNFDKMQAELLKARVEEVLKPFGELVKDSKVTIRKSRKPNSDEYEIEVDVEAQKAQKK